MKRQYVILAIACITLLPSQALAQVRVLGTIGKRTPDIRAIMMDACGNTGYMAQAVKDTELDPRTIHRLKEGQRIILKHPECEHPPLTAVNETITMLYSHPRVVVQSSNSVSLQKELASLRRSAAYEKQAFEENLLEERKGESQRTADAVKAALEAERAKAPLAPAPAPVLQPPGWGGREIILLSVGALALALIISLLTVLFYRRGKIVYPKTKKVRHAGRLYTFSFQGVDEFGIPVYKCNACGAGNLSEQTHVFKTHLGQKHASDRSATRATV